MLAMVLAGTPISPTTCLTSSASSGSFCAASDQEPVAARRSGRRSRAAGQSAADSHGERRHCVIFRMLFSVQDLPSRPPIPPSWHRRSRSQSHVVKTAINVHLTPDWHVTITFLSVGIFARFSGLKTSLTRRVRLRVLDGQSGSGP
jgi:hypothetical protein